MIYFTSDNHWFHGNVIIYSKRPFRDRLQMNAVMMKRWNRTIQPEDALIHAGDFVFGKPQWTDDILARLNGTKFLTPGNHDRPRCVKSPGWAVTAPSLEFEEQGYTFKIRHFPWDYPDTKDAHLGDANTIWIHGHSHGNNGMIHMNQIDVSVELWDYAPVSIDRIIEVWETHVKHCRNKT